MRNLILVLALGAFLSTSAANASDGGKTCKSKGKKATACMTKSAKCKDMKAMKAGGKCNMKAMKSGTMDCCKTKAAAAPKS